MKQIIASAFITMAFLIGMTAQAQQDKSKRPSPPASVTQKISSGATLTIDYSQPSLKGRTIGTTVEPMQGQVWRMGANEATTFQSDKDVKIEGKKLPAGKYSMFGLWGSDGFTVIFNKKNKIWGTEYEANKGDDVLRVLVKPSTAETSQEKLTYTISESGVVTLHWGTMAVSFKVK